MGKCFARGESVFSVNNLTRDQSDAGIDTAILGVSPDALIAAIPTEKSGIPWIPRLNDDTTMSKREIALQIMRDHPDKLDLPVEYPLSQEEIQKRMLGQE